MNRRAQLTSEILTKLQDAITKKLIDNDPRYLCATCHHIFEDHWIAFSGDTEGCLGNAPSATTCTCNAFTDEV